MHSVMHSVLHYAMHSIIQLLLRSDSRTPVIYCDPIFFAREYTSELRADLLAQARALEV